MADPMIETRSFMPASRVHDVATDGGWAEEAKTWDAVASHAFIHRVRWHTGLSQEAFASAYRIDLERLRALERGRAQADSVLSAYLMVIDRAPEIVRAALASA